MGLLNRRHLRIKVLQSLYAFFQSENQTLAVGEKELFHSINKIHELYVRLLTLLPELRRIAEIKLEERKQKLLPSAEDLNPNTRFVQNKILLLLENSKALEAHSKSLKINWGLEEVLLRKLYAQINQSEEFEAYMAADENSFDHDKQFVMQIFKKYVANFQGFHDVFEEQSIYWNDDLDLVCVMVLKTIRDLPEEAGVYFDLIPLFKDEEDDLDFIKRLFRSSVQYKEEHNQLIEAKAGNWELERIALMDRIIMNMALSEAREFSNIPLKVSLNEFIEISKFYSTPKSNSFINGILDRLFPQLKEENKIRKAGRGLIE